MSRSTRLCGVLLASLALGACGDSDPDDGHGHEHNDEEELITTITLTFTAPDGTTVTGSFEDTDGDGGAAGSAEDITLAAGVSYDLDISFSNVLEQPAEDITEEIRAEAEEHQVFLLGGIAGPATPPGDGVIHAYADLESDYGANAVGEDLPVGLANTLSVGPEVDGEFELRVRLQHLPELNGTPQKSADLAQRLADGDQLPGDVDVDVTFTVSVE